MASGKPGDAPGEVGPIPLDIDNVHMILQVEQEQIQKRTFTNWVNSQLSKRRPPCLVLDLFNDFRDGSRLLDLLEVMTGQQMSREKGRGIFQYRSNLETALSFLRRKSIKLVNIHIPDIIDGKPSIILGLLWTIILHFHIEELASTLSFSSRQSSMESLASLDSHSTASSSSTPRRVSPLHNRFRISAKKALLLWVREQCHRVGCTLNVKDFKASWRSGVVFLAILKSLRPDVVDLSKARTRSNKQNLSEAFRIAEQELLIPRLLDPNDVDVRDPDEKSIMTYVAQFLQYSRDYPVADEDMQKQYLSSPKCLSPVNLPTHFTPAVGASPLRQASATQKVREVTYWLQQAYEELLEGWVSTEGESYAERYQVFQTFVVSFHEQRRPVMPLLTAMRRSPKMSEEQRALRRAWDSLAEKLRQFKTELDLSLPAPLDGVGRWLLRVEEALAEEEPDIVDHSQAAQQARNKLALLKASVEEMGTQFRTFQMFPNVDEYGATMVPFDKLEEIKRRFTSIRVTAKYHGIKLEYQEYKHLVLHLLDKIGSKLRSWRSLYSTQEAVCVLLQDWHNTVEKQGLVSQLDANLLKLKLTAEKYTSKSALARDSQRIEQQVKAAEAAAAASLEAVSEVKGYMSRVLSAWESYYDCLSSLQAWLDQETQAHSFSQKPEVTCEVMTEWSSCRSRLNDVANFLAEVVDAHANRAMADELRRVNTLWEDFVENTTFVTVSQPSSGPRTPQVVQALLREAAQLIKQPVEVLSGPLSTYRKRLQFVMKKIEEVDLDVLMPSPECSAEMLHKLRLSLPEVIQTLQEAEEVCLELQRTVSGLESRLAELQYWEREAQDVYRLLNQGRACRHGEDLRTREQISRGLQLEGQLVTEEQDLLMMVMTAQKNSPLQYLIATVMQDRVRGAVGLSQEVLGMLSSLGSRKEQSPARDQPPPKIFVQMYDPPAPDQPQYLDEPEVSMPTETQPSTETISQHQGHPYNCQQQTEFHTQFYPQTESPLQCESTILPPECFSKPEPSVQPQAQNQNGFQSQDQLQVDQCLEHPAHKTTHREEQHQSQTTASVSVQVRNSRVSNRPWATQKDKNGHLSAQQTSPHTPQTELQNQCQLPTSSMKDVQTSLLSHIPLQTQFYPSPFPHRRSEAESPIHAHSQTLPEGRLPALAQAPPQAYTEAYTKAQALARDRFEEAKHCLQDHILEVITVFNGRRIFEEHSAQKEEALNILDPELLEEFLRAAEGMEAFCSPSQLRDMEFFTQSVRTQWEACFSPEGSMAQAGRHLEALRELCDTLSPEDAHRLAQAQLRECERRLAAIQRQFSGDRDTPPPEPGVPLEFIEGEVHSPQRLVRPQTTVRMSSVETKTPHRTTTEDFSAKQELLNSYQTSKTSLQEEISKNKLHFQTEILPGLSSVDRLSGHIQELQTRKQVTEKVWLDFELKSSQCSQLRNEGHVIEQERENLAQQWDEQSSRLEGRITFLGSVVGLLGSVETQTTQISECFDGFVEKPMDITAFVLTSSHSLQDLKDLEARMQRTMDRLSMLDVDKGWAYSEPEPEMQSAVSSLAQSCWQRLEQLGQQMKKHEMATCALERFLTSLHNVKGDMDSSTGIALSSDVATIQDCHARLTVIRPAVLSLEEKAVHLDQLLQGAQLGVTWGDAPTTCSDAVAILGRRLEEGIAALVAKQKSLHKEKESRALGLRKRTLLGALSEIEAAAEREGLKEPTIPAVQRRMRVLTDLESRLVVHGVELQNLLDSGTKMVSSVSHTSVDLMEDLMIQWDDTQRAVKERQEQCRILMELLKKFQNCRSGLGNTLQTAEQTISEQASYMSKDNLQRLIIKVTGIKEDLGSLGNRVEEIRGICRQLQSLLKKIPDCADAPFESEANVLVDRWLDVTEKTDAYMDNLEVALELWDKLLLLGGDVDGWMSSKIVMFAERHPFHSENEVIALQEEIQSQEKSIEHFHKKSCEIQGLLQSKESPLELQVIETQLRKKLEQVKELFSDSSEVFRELLLVRERLSEQMAECQAALQSIQTSLNGLSSSQNTDVLTQIEMLSTQLEMQAEQADGLLQEVSLMSRVASPQALEALAADGVRLKESVHATREIIVLKTDEEKEGVVKVIKDECQAFDEWFQDLQLSVNECFENPEQRQDLEASVQKLAGFLAYQEGENRLTRIGEKVVESQAQLPLKQTSLLETWLQEQKEELATFRAHCRSRHSQLEACVRTLDGLQEETSRLTEWLVAREERLAQEHVSHLQDELLKASDCLEGLRSLLASVRKQGLRGDKLLRESDDLLERLDSLQTRLRGQADAQNILARDTKAFQTLVDNTQVWLSELPHKVEALSCGTEGRPALTEEQRMGAQAVLSLRGEGDSKLQKLMKSSHQLIEEHGLEERRRQEVFQMLNSVKKQWETALRSAEELLRQAEAQSALANEKEVFQVLADHTQTWVRELQERVQTIASSTEDTQQFEAAQAIFNQRTEGNVKVLELRNRGQQLSEWQGIEESVKQKILQTVCDTEQLWMAVMQSVEEMHKQAEVRIALDKDYQAFQTLAESTQAWVRELQQKVSELVHNTEEGQLDKQLDGAKTILSNKDVGDTKLQELRRSAKELTEQRTLEENGKQHVFQLLHDTEQEFKSVLQSGEELLGQAVALNALSKERQAFQVLSDSCQAWLRELQERMLHLGQCAEGHQTEIEEQLQVVQTILSLKSEGDIKLQDLRKSSQQLSERQILEETGRRDVLHTICDIERQWHAILQSAEELHRQAELQRVLTRDNKAFQVQADSIQAWLSDLQHELEALNCGTKGSQAQIEERLQGTQTLISLRSEVNAKMQELKSSGQNLSVHLEDCRKQEVIQTVYDVEHQWDVILQTAEDLHRFLQGFAERLVSSQNRKQQAQDRLDQLRRQTVDLPRLFSWPGLGDRRLAMEQAQSLLNQTKTLLTTLSTLRAEATELFHLTSDPSWSDSIWDTLEASITVVIEQLTEACQVLEEGIQMERQCAQLVEQHSAAQDWLQDQVQGIGPVPEERQALQNTIKTLRALLKTADREEKEMKQLEAAKEALWSRCSPGGQTALSEEVGHLQERRISSQALAQQLLQDCEARLQMTEEQQTHRVESLKKEIRVLEKGLCNIEKTLSERVQQADISQLQHFWQNLKVCETLLEELRLQVVSLQETVELESAHGELPLEVTSAMASHNLQRNRLAAVLSEEISNCAGKAALCVEEALQALQKWIQTEIFTDSPLSIQAVLEEGEKMQGSLEEALQQQMFLTDILGTAQAEVLERKGADVLKEVSVKVFALQQKQKDLEDREKQQMIKASAESVPEIFPMEQMHTVQPQQPSMPSLITKDTYPAKPISPILCEAQEADGKRPELQLPMVTETVEKQDSRPTPPPRAKFQRKPNVTTEKKVDGNSTQPCEVLSLVSDLREAYKESQASLAPTAIVSAVMIKSDDSHASALQIVPLKSDLEQICSQQDEINSKYMPESLDTGIPNRHIKDIHTPLPQAHTQEDSLENVLAFESKKVTGIVLDTNVIHIHTPEIVSSMESETLRFASSGKMLDTSWDSLPKDSSTGIMVADDAHTVVCDSAYEALSRGEITLAGSVSQKVEVQMETKLGEKTEPILMTQEAELTVPTPNINIQQVDTPEPKKRSKKDKVSKSSKKRYIVLDVQQSWIKEGEMHKTQEAEGEPLSKGAMSMIPLQSNATHLTRGEDTLVEFKTENVEQPSIADNCQTVYNESLAICGQTPVAPPRRKMKEQERKIQEQTFQDPDSGNQKGPQQESLPEGQHSTQEEMSLDSSIAELCEQKPAGLTMHKIIFPDIQQLLEAGWGSLTQGEVNQKTYPSLERNRDAQLSRVVLKVLGSQSHPADLSILTMGHQVEKAKEYVGYAQEQIALLCKKRSAEGQETAQLVQWNETLRLATDVLHAKEIQQQLVIKFHSQTETVKAMLQRLAAELKIAKVVALQSSSLKAENLRSFLRNMDQERVVLGELLQIHSKTWPHLNLADQAVAQIQVEELQEEWRALEMSVEASLHNISFHNQLISNLLLETQDLQIHLETLKTSLIFPQPGCVNWDINRVGELMLNKAELIAAKQHYLHLQQTAVEILDQDCIWETEKQNISLVLQSVKMDLDNIQDQLSAQQPTIRCTKLSKILKTVEEIFTWKKQTEKDIEMKKKIGLLPEEVHRQIRHMKKLQTEILAKQKQLESLRSEIKELPQDLDKADFTMLFSMLKSLQDLSSSVSEKLSHSLHVVETGLQMREKMSEQIADVEAWVVAHSCKGMAPENGAMELESKLLNLQENLSETERQMAVIEALLIKSRDMSLELRIEEHCNLNDKLVALKDDIRTIIASNQRNCQDMQQAIESKESSLSRIKLMEESLGSLSADLKKYTFPVTTDLLLELQPLKHLILEKKCQVDQLHDCNENQRRELLCSMAELHNKIHGMLAKSKEHDKHLSNMLFIEGLNEIVKAEVFKTKDENMIQADQFKACQTLLIQFPKMKNFCQVGKEQLHNVSQDMAPSQLSLELQKIHHTLETLLNWELIISSDIKILVTVLLDDLSDPTELKAMLTFLSQAEMEVQGSHLVVPTVEAIRKELGKCSTLQKSIELRMQVVEAVENRYKAGKKGQEPSTGDVKGLTERTMKVCHLRMESLVQALNEVKAYNAVIQSTAGLLQDAEFTLLSTLCNGGPCANALPQVQRALGCLNEEIQDHMAQLQALAPQHSCLCPHQIEELHSYILAQLLVWLATLRAQGQQRMEALQSCTEKERQFEKCLNEIQQQLVAAEGILSECTSGKITSVEECLDQQEKLKVLVEKVDSLQERLKELQEWCPEQACSGYRSGVVSSTWKRWARLRHCAHKLKSYLQKRAQQWSSVRESVERATFSLSQLQGQLPEFPKETVPVEDLQDCLANMKQYLEWLDCEHRALAALELRVARLMGVPSHQEQTPPIPLCQELHAMQNCYRSLKEQGMQGRRALETEVQEREQLREEICRVQENLLTALNVVSVPSNSTQELQKIQEELGSQKVVLQGIMDGLRMKYTDMYILVPLEIEGPLQEATRSLEEVEKKVTEVVELSSPHYRLGTRASGIQTGLQSVLRMLEQQSPTVTEAENLHKHIWEELEHWHSLLVALEMEVTGLSEEQPEEAQLIAEQLAEVQQLHQQVVKRAEDRGTFLTAVHSRLREHEEMIKSSDSWLSETQSWLNTPCTYATSKCLRSHMSALQSVLDDSQQMRKTLQSFTPVLHEMSLVFDSSALEEQLTQADQRVDDVQQIILGPLALLEKAAADVETIENETDMLEKNLNEIKSASSLPDMSALSTDEQLRIRQVTLASLQSMRKTITKMQQSKLDLSLPEGGRESLTIMHVVDHLLLHIQDLENVTNQQIAALEETTRYSEKQTPEAVVEARRPSPIPEEPQGNEADEGQIHIVHLEEDALKRHGATLRTVEESDLSWGVEMCSTEQDGKDTVPSEEQSLGEVGALQVKSEGIDCPLTSEIKEKDGFPLETTSAPLVTEEWTDTKPEPQSEDTTPVSKESFEQSLVTNPPSITLPTLSPRTQARCVIS